MINLQLLEESAVEVKERLGAAAPSLSMILGSGWGDVIEDFEVQSVVSYTDIPCMGKTGVKGHAGRLVSASYNDVDILIFQGRRHYYEGCGWTPIAFPVYLCRSLGCKELLITNAAGGIRDDLKPGSLMMIRDHINAMGANPLIGPHDPVWGQRFPDQSEVYSRTLLDRMRGAAESQSIDITEGVYLAASGPVYETPAEITMYRQMGADAVGMSTVPEAILANASGMKAAGISCITNYAAGISESPLDHDEVIEQTTKSKPVMTELLKAFISNS